MADSQREYWNRLANRYEHKFAYDSDGGRIKLEYKTFALLQCGQIEDDDTLLEIGCGTGAYTEILTQWGFDVTGIDVSENMLNIARRKEGRYCWSDVHALHYDPKTFDAVIGFYVLQYVNLDKAIPQICRVLKDNGKIAFIEPNVWNPLVFWKTKLGLVKRLKGISKQATSFSGHSLSKALSNGFQNISVQYLEYGVSPDLFSETPILKGIAGSLLITGEKI